jgi:hypothetical protein
VKELEVPGARPIKVLLQVVSMGSAAIALLLLVFSAYAGNLSEAAPLFAAVGFFVQLYAERRVD